MTLFAAGLGTLASSTHTGLVLAATLAMGSGWMMTLTTLNGTAQVNLPSEMRARGMGCYLTAMAFSMAVGSFLWGQLAARTDIVVAQQTAAATLLFAAVVSFRFGLSDPR